MDAPRNPQPGNTGSLNVYSLDFTSNNATLVTKFNAAVFDFPTLSMIAFQIIPIDNGGGSGSSVSQYFILDCYGRQLFFGTYDDSFSNPNNSLISKGSLPLKDFILSSNNGFVLSNTKYVNLLYLDTTSNP